MDTQVTYLDSLIWVDMPWVPVGKAVRAVMLKDKVLAQAYINLAKSSGKLSLAYPPSLQGRGFTQAHHRATLFVATILP